MNLKMLYNFFRETTGGDSLWGIVNNAGLSSFGEVEWVPLTCYRRIMEANMFGVIMGLQEALPLIRRARGRIVNTTSGVSRQILGIYDHLVLNFGLMSPFSFSLP